MYRRIVSSEIGQGIQALSSHWQPEQKQNFRCLYKPFPDREKIITNNNIEYKPLSRKLEHSFEPLFKGWKEFGLH